MTGSLPERTSRKQIRLPLSTTKFLRFLAVGLPSFLLAVPMNWFLVEQLGLPASPAYALVIVTQVTANFFLCRWLVFDRSEPRDLWIQFLSFVGGVAIFRLLDWALYSWLVSLWPRWYLGFQLMNVVIFATSKFAFSLFIFERRTKP